MVCNAALPLLFTATSSYTSQNDLHLFQQPVVDEEGEFPYWTLPHPIIYKLRPCCLDTFVPDTSTLLHLVQQHQRTLPTRRLSHFPPLPNKPTTTLCTLPQFYKLVKQDIPDSGVAYLYRGRKYLLIEDIPHPCSKWFQEATLQDWNMGKEKSKCGLYELIRFDIEKIASLQDSVDVQEGHFLFSFTRKSDYSVVEKKSEAKKVEKTFDEEEKKNKGIMQSGIVKEETSDTINSIPPPNSSSTETPSKKPFYPCNCQKIRMKQNVHRELFLHHFSTFLRLIKMRKRLLMQGLASTPVDIPEEDDLLYYLIQTKVKKVLMESKHQQSCSSGIPAMEATSSSTCISRTTSYTSMPDLSECFLFQSQPDLSASAFEEVPRTVTSNSPPDPQYLSMRRWIANERDAQAILTELHLMNPAYY